MVDLCWSFDRSQGRLVDSIWFVGSCLCLGGYSCMPCCRCFPEVHHLMGWRSCGPPPTHRFSLLKWTMWEWAGISMELLEYDGICLGTRTFVDKDRTLRSSNPANTSDASKSVLSSWFLYSNMNKEQGNPRMRQGLPHHKLLQAWIWKHATPAAWWKSALGFAVLPAVCGRRAGPGATQQDNWQAEQRDHQTVSWGAN